MRLIEGTTYRIKTHNELLNYGWIYRESWLHVSEARCRFTGSLIKATVVNDGGDKIFIRYNGRRVVLHDWMLEEIPEERNQNMLKIEEGRTYRFKQLCDLNGVTHFNSSTMGYLAGTTVVATCIEADCTFKIPRQCDKKDYWRIYPHMLEEVCEPVEEPAYTHLVVSPTAKLTKHTSEDAALEAIAEKIEGGEKGTYKMYQLYQEVETPKLDISSMIRKVINYIKS